MVLEKTLESPLDCSFLGGAVVKNLPANAGDTRDVDLIPGSGRSPGGGKWQPILVLLPGESQGQGSLVGCQRIHAFELWCWRRILRVPWTARRSNQLILKEINAQCSLEGLTLKLKLQYFGHLRQRTDSLEKTDVGKG